MKCGRGERVVEGGIPFHNGSLGRNNGEGKKANILAMKEATGIQFRGQKEGGEGMC